jgi:diaminopropionate ammonia-lyase
VHRVAGSYQRSVEAASAAAARPGHILVADTASDGYRDIPLQVMRGYAVLAAEAADQCERLDDRPTHVFVQAGVGGLAGAVTGYLRDRWGEDVRVVVVEPAGAACLLASVRAGELTEITTTGTSLGRLDCDRPSSVAWDLLSPLADAFLTVADADAERAAQLLTDEGVAVSPCGAAGAAALLAYAGSDDARALLGLDERSRVLLIGTEEAAGDTAGDG